MFPSARPPHQASRNARRTPVRSPGRALAAKRRAEGGPQPSRRCPLWRRGRCLWRCVRSTAGIRTATAAIRGAVAAAPCRGCPAANPSHRAHPLLSPGPALGALVALWWFGGAEAAIPPVLDLKAPIVPRSCLLWCGAGGRACTRSRVSLCSDNGTFSLPARAQGITLEQKREGGTSCGISAQSCGETPSRPSRAARHAGLRPGGARCAWRLFLCVDP